MIFLQQLKVMKNMQNGQTRFIEQAQLCINIPEIWTLWMNHTH